MQVTWSEFESYHDSEKVVNESEEHINFTAFMATIIVDSINKENPSDSSESSDSEDDEMSFDSAYETLYNESLSLKKEQVVWKASKRSLINKVKTLKDEKKSMLCKVSFLE